MINVGSMDVIVYGVFKGLIVVAIKSLHKLLIIPRKLATWFLVMELAANGQPQGIYS
jgi:hypothetical protein